MKTSIKLALVTTIAFASTAAFANENEKAGALNAPHVLHEKTTFQCEDGQTVVTQRAPHQNMNLIVNGDARTLERNKRSSWHLWSHVSANNYLRANYSDAEGYGWSDNGQTGTLYYPAQVAEGKKPHTVRTKCQVVSQ